MTERRCECGHRESNHPFGLSGNLICDGHCLGCDCKQFKPAPSGAPLNTRQQTALAVLRAIGPLKVETLQAVLEEGGHPKPKGTGDIDLWSMLDSGLLRLTRDFKLEVQS